MKDQSSDLKNE